MNVNKILDELKQFNVSDYEIKDIAMRYIKSQYLAKYGIYLNDDQIDRYHIETIEDEINKIHNKFISVYGNDQIALIFYHFSGYRFHLEFIKNDKVLLNRYYQSNNNEILELVRYAINGEFDDNYAIINKMFDEHIPKIHYDNRGWELSILNKDSMIHDIRIKSFKNGKVQITGLNNVQLSRIKTGFEIKEKFKNISTKF